MGAGRRSLIALGAVAWVAALITYEVAILVAPAAALAANNARIPLAQMAVVKPEWAWSRTR